MSRRIGELDGLRALAILAVFLRHTFQVPMLWMGVDLFFVLSGFLITGILLDAPKENFSSYIGAFYARRARRILPPYLLILLTVTVLFGTFWMRRWYLYFGLMNYVACFWHDPHNRALGGLWSLAVEEQFYLVWPPVVFWVAPRKLPRILLALLVAAPLLRGLATPCAQHQPFNQGHWFIYDGLPFRMDCLAAGALLTFVWRAHSERIRRYGYLGLGATLLAPLLMYGLVHRFGGFAVFDNTVRGNVVSYEVTLLAVTGVFLWALGGRYTAVLTLPPVRWLARISYSFYLVHVAALDFLPRLLPRLLPASPPPFLPPFLNAPLLVYGAAFALSLGYAELSWRFVERPLLHGGNRKALRREAEAALPNPGRGEAAAALASL